MCQRQQLIDTRRKRAGHREKSIFRLNNSGNTLSFSPLSLVNVRHNFSASQLYQSRALSAHAKWNTSASSSVSCAVFVVNELLYKTLTTSGSCRPAIELIDNAEFLLECRPFFAGDVIYGQPLMPGIITILMLAYRVYCSLNCTPASGYLINPSV